jgi:hypothetical protein
LGKIPTRIRIRFKLKKGEPDTVTGLGHQRCDLANKQHYHLKKSQVPVIYDMYTCIGFAICDIVIPSTLYWHHTPHSSIMGTKKLWRGSCNYFTLEYTCIAGESRCWSAQLKKNSITFQYHHQHTKSTYVCSEDRVCYWINLFEAQVQESRMLQFRERVCFANMKRWNLENIYPILWTRGRLCRPCPGWKLFLSDETVLYKILKIFSQERLIYSK